MNTFLRLTAVIALAAVPVTGVHAQALDNSVRLHLALDPDGRVRLSTEPETTGPLPLQINQPLPARLQSPTHHYALDLSLASRHEAAAPTACLNEAGMLRLNPFAGCDLFGVDYDGLPGAVSAVDIALSLEDSRQRYGFDLRYGLGWLDATHHDGTPGAWPLNGRPPVAANLILPGMAGLVADAVGHESLGMGGWVGIGQGLRLHLDYQHADGSVGLFQPMAAPWTLASQDSVSFGVSYGRFFGALIGRQIRPAIPGQGIEAQNSLDLGFSLRMPWNAELEFGARNLITNPAKPEPPTSLERQQNDLRVPYLRYHQEL